MKTIRHNTYETNSSSTHSITVINKGQYSGHRPRTAPIIIDNVLLPYNLNESDAYSTIESGEGGYILKCCDSYQKAALTVHYLNSLDEYVDDYGDITAEELKAFKAEALSYLQCALSLNGIEAAAECVSYYYCSENGNCPLVDVITADNPIAAFKKYVTEIVLNDDMIMIDEEIPY
jgi:hypothetical protein